ncbi:hypothetical protein NW752_005214 [Fusarium irregulare]|uniref:Uncharacterized protein n=1 Tax=Fusarium irregulare TaxID=2494466 RepID=A0A9W8PMJ2_9HYPO|nr:hypothetical protein NW766_008412 [Fusarium irregulare]KAJ4020111.1 hypothetical protein NW752_005214 [Fusarium irregulare]
MNTMTTNPDTPWVAHGSEEFEEVDEPPELNFKKQQFTANDFQRTSIRPSTEKSSLLTKAINGNSDDDLYTPQNTTHTQQRRRSLVSNVSFASTADLTSDTGFTSPSRPSTPSPPLPEMAMLRLHHDRAPESTQASLLGAAVKLQQAKPEEPKKRCIQFACGGKPAAPAQAPAQPPRSQPMAKAPSAQEAPRKSCIKFACPPRPASTQNTPPRYTENNTSRKDATPKASPSTPKRTSALSAAPRQITPRRQSVSRPKFLRADSSDLATDSSQFHEFASGITREDDWIRRDSNAVGVKLTINDTLTKENNIRRLATEAEQEAEEEDELDEEDADADEDDDDEEEDEDEDELDVDLDEDDDEDEDDEDDDSDGYHTDEETGFADSDDDDEDDDMRLWTPGAKSVVHIGSGATMMRRPSLHEMQSDSSIATVNSQRVKRRTKNVRYAEETPDLPDSTDFVCGTLDEDRPLEEAYLSCLAARRNEKLRVIPQDIDPSFPASEPEEENDGEIFNPVHHESDADEFFGEMEDLHQDRDRSRRRRKSEHASPKRFRSPPPKRLHSPPPKARARSPKPLFNRQSPRRAKSPAPMRKPITTPLGSPRCGQVNFNLAGRPGLTQTKSLPRGGAMCHQRKHPRNKMTHDNDTHIRGAIDITKGLESKRQRRKEKFHQKYCNRARRGKIPEAKPVPGRGTERMRELGLLMAGKKDQTNYVLSI